MQCQRHQKILANGCRAGFFMGDAAGVGKGRQVKLKKTLNQDLYLYHALFKKWHSINILLNRTTLYFSWSVDSTNVTAFLLRVIFWKRCMGTHRKKAWASFYKDLFLIATYLRLIPIATIYIRYTCRRMQTCNRIGSIANLYKVGP